MAVLSLLVRAPRDLSRVVKLVAGRMPDQADPDQVLASFRLQQDAGVRVGTVIRVPLYSASQRSAVLSGAAVKPAGPTVALRVVGIEAAEVEFPFANTPGYDLYATQAFARTVSQKIVLSPDYLVRLRGGPAGLPRFQTQARALGAAVSVAVAAVAAGTVLTQTCWPSARPGPPHDRAQPASCGPNEVRWWQHDRNLARYHPGLSGRQAGCWR